MAIRIEPTSKPLYEQDFYAWSKAQADLLRAGRFSDLDLEHLIEEVDDLGEPLYRSACSRVRTIIEPLLKLQFSPAAGPRPGWIETLYTQRSDLEGELTQSLRPRVQDALPRLYMQARGNTARALEAYGERAAADALPATCPYALDQVTGDWLP
jgi:hypothetical protein